MSRRARTGVILTAGITLGVAISLGHGVLADRSDSDPAQRIAFDEVVTLTQVMRRIRESYVEPVEDEALLKDAIRGMLTGLDPHSAYLDKDDFADINISTSGKFGGLGIEVTMQDGFVKVVAPIDDTPAQKAGMQSGDLIIRLDDKAVKGMTLRDAVNIMRGEPGSNIDLTVVREGENAPLKISITRAIIRIQSVKQRMLESNYGYVRITQFQNETGRDVEAGIRELISKNGAAIKGLVLDLRNNPGGVLNASVDVSNVFLDAGLVVYIQGRESASRRDFNSRDGDVLSGAPIVVLINEGSASASEIVAGALQDRGRAIIMGRKSFGKGSVQSIIPLSDVEAIKLTTARYYTPSGRSIQAEGIEPDIKVDRVVVSAVEKAAFDPIKEADLSGSLTNENGEAATAEETAKAEEEKTPLAQRDYTLYEALNLLKGLTILEARK